MKTLLVLLLLTITPSVAFAQNQPTATASAPGCGTSGTKFNVKTNSSQHPLAKPDSGKALVYFLQDDTYFQSVPRPTTRFGLDANWIGATHTNSYFYVSVDPGEHHICADWQSFVGLNTGHKSAAAHLTAVEGQSYFFLVKNFFITKENLPAGMKMSPVDSDEAQLLMSKFAFSTSTPKK
jgi:hypothetical protein